MGEKYGRRNWLNGREVRNAARFDIWGPRSKLHFPHARHKAHYLHVKRILAYASEIGLPLAKHKISQWSIIIRPYRGDFATVGEPQ
jgi:hypothetical protein